MQGKYKEIFHSLLPLVEQISKMDAKDQAEIFDLVNQIKIELGQHLMIAVSPTEKENEWLEGLLLTDFGENDGEHALALLERRQSE